MARVDPKALTVQLQPLIKRTVVFPIWWVKGEEGEGGSWKSSPEPNEKVGIIKYGVENARIDWSLGGGIGINSYPERFSGALAQQIVKYGIFTVELFQDKFRLHVRDFGGLLEKMGTMPDLMMDGVHVWTSDPKSYRSRILGLIEPTRGMD